MTTYTLTAGYGSFSYTNINTSGAGQDGNVILIHRTVAEQQWVVNHFTRWSENNTNSLTVTYRNTPSSYGPTKYYGLE